MHHEVIRGTKKKKWGWFWELQTWVTSEFFLFSPLMRLWGRMSTRMRPAHLPASRSTEGPWQPLEQVHSGPQGKEPLHCLPEPPALPPRAAKLGREDKETVGSSEFTSTSADGVEGGGWRRGAGRLAGAGTTVPHHLLVPQATKVMDHLPTNKQSMHFPGGDD